MSKITIDRKVLEQALDALENNAGEFRVEGAAAILREALAHPAAQQTEPAPGYCKHCKAYTIEAPLPAVPLTVEQIFAIGKELGLKCRLGGNPNIDLDYARAIEAAHKIGGAE